MLKKLWKKPCWQINKINQT